LDRKKEQASPKRERKLKAETKEEEEEKVKEELKIEQKVKRLKEERVKSEVCDAEAVAKSIVLSIAGLSRKSVAMEFTVPAGDLQFHALATSMVHDAKPSAVRVPCSVEMRENAEGFEASGEARMNELCANSAYRLSIEVSSPGGQTASSMEVVVPQRAHPERWSIREAQLWCSSLKVPELAVKVAEYGVDGATLLSFQEEDLRGLGVSAPFLLRRVLSSLKALGRS